MDSINVKINELKVYWVLPESENGLRPPMNIIPPNQFHFGSPGCGGNGQHTDVYGFISIKDFESAIKALSDIKSSLDRICSLLEKGK